jgi:cytochrome c
MKCTMTLIAAAVAAALASGAHAADPKAAEALAKNSGCFACHSVDKKLVGPGYKEIADRYRGDKKAEANLIQKVKAGGKGAWGDIPMSPNAHVKDEDLKTLVQWILSLK